MVWSNTAIRAGHCTACGTLNWRTVQHPTSDETIILWPAPTTVYATQRTLIDGAEVRTKGIDFCGTCAPTDVEMESAPLRYRYWYSEGYRVWLHAWLHDFAKLTDETRDAVMRQWQQDRDRAEEIIGGSGGGRDAPSTDTVVDA